MVRGLAGFGLRQNVPETNLSGTLGLTRSAPAAYALIIAPIMFN